ncbi:S-methyl-5-thioribose kinase [Anaerococcus vaginalis]|uniref:S-methyl-5-thioribose kinase n=1 Tax=Anaerococcus vaginalis TaxID=33037 RepID=UPI00290DB217|nr:S-methyl-5-thioribose kinase [Anaerococcus vaginalis]MDU6546511.1 S-methyl-5-thioribose kinase [Anaerococcus vaginalis]
MDDANLRRKIIEYVLNNTRIFKNNDLDISEVGDGNVNYIYKITDGKKSVIVKFSDDYIRGSTTRKLSSARSKIESEILQKQFELSNGLAPEVYSYSEENSFIVMEDLSDYKVFRESLKNKEILFKDFGTEMAKFLYNTLFKTTDLVMDIKSKKETVARFVNYDMCEISERLVFTEPYMNNQGLNSYSNENEEFIKKEFYNDPKMKYEVAKLRNLFMTKSESMIHGDLHSGSIFVNEKGLKVFDPEFAFYGPMGYDIGNIIASLMISYVVNYYENDKKDNKFSGWIKETILSIIENYIKIYNENYSKDVNTYMFDNEDFKKYYLTQVLRETSGYAGTEIIRRTIGVAKVWDIERVLEKEYYSDIEKDLLVIGKKLVMNSDKFYSRESYTELIENIGVEYGN